MVNYLQAFWQATRPRTYPLAVAGIIVANALAYSRIGSFETKNWQIFLLSLWVALGLQILSNLANDYGDGIRGTDAHRLDRQTAQGTINPKTLKKLIISWALFIFGCGIGLLWLSFNSVTDFFTFLGLGIIAIIAAVTYTMGKNPYGYNAKGEIA
ncbi:1,4-dihydroxy-2-naphthoate octaprenyltransferase, partial [Acinetobacter pittii]|uniref:1,4-dihydroxy-2-naphthoate octaprenyltransferase n=1 Tax=Acinetobacter pittii TaxID=48296 RepID=UPI00227A4E59